jgi:uncharacterized membrane protein YjjP (DUF1212 family)/uncharacterized membrane protein YjjB (DUF3815 family)
MIVNAATPRTDTATLLELMCCLGQAYLASGEQMALVETYLRRIASTAGIGEAHIVAFPTAIFIALNDGNGERVTLAEGPTETLRLDQIADVYELGAAAQNGSVTPHEGLQQLDKILARAARFGPIASVLGHTILTVGLAMSLKSTPVSLATWVNLCAAAVLGTIVGALKAFNRGRAVLALPLPVVAAALVSVLVYLAVKWRLPIDPQHVLVPPLVTFLSGAMLSLGMVELAYGDMVSGSSRLVTGFVKLVLLAFGLVAGAGLVGYAPDTLLDAPEQTAAPPLMPWAGVVVFGVGAYIHFSAPRKSFLWMLLVLLVAFAAQQVATRLFGVEISGFFGTLLATPLAYVIQNRFKGPPAMVTFLPSFWLLVPGSLGLLSVTRMLSDRGAGLEGLVTALFAFVSIALGTLVGASLYKWLSEQFTGRQTGTTPKRGRIG